MSTWSTQATAVNSRGKLTIEFTCYGSKNSTSSKYALGGSANWSGLSFIGGSGETNPAIGEDFFGFAWAGGFESSNSAANAWLKDSSIQQPIYLSDGIPNAAIIWEFNELYTTPYMNSYIDRVLTNVTLTKNKLEGNGNTAQAIMKYIHTYQKNTRSIDISAGTDGVGGGFSLSNTDKQWNIVCIMNGLYY